MHMRWPRSHRQEVTDERRGCFPFALFLEKRDFFDSLQFPARAALKTKQRACGQATILAAQFVFRRYPSSRKRRNRLSCVKQVSADLSIQQSGMEDLNLPPP